MESVVADLGGTELFAPLRDVFASSCDPSFQRVVFVITDGQVASPSQVLDLVDQYPGEVRVFTFGIGAEVDRSFISNLAAKGNGTAEFVDTKTQRLERTGGHVYISNFNSDDELKDCTSM